MQFAEVISEYLRISIVSVTIGTTPPELPTPSAAVRTLIGVALSWYSGRGVELILVFAIDLLLEIGDPFIDGALCF